MNVQITRLRPDIALPIYQTTGAAAFDLATADDHVIEARAAKRVGTGLVIATPSGYVLILTARSSLFSRKGLMLANGVGTIDADYCGPADELKLSLWNPSDAPVIITAGERLAQGLFIPIERAVWIEGQTASISRGGFGSTQ
jgi:dUTP pyrophosphatase